MSSPAPSSTGGAKEKKPLEQITFRFCSECSNMLYPREAEDENKLLFTCRTCNFSEPATSTCIYRNILNNAAGETAGVTQDVASDPTVGVVSSVSSAAVGDGVASPASTLPRPADGSTYIYCQCCGVIELCSNHFAAPPSDSEAGSDCESLYDQMAATTIDMNDNSHVWASNNSSEREAMGRVRAEEYFYNLVAFEDYEEEEGSIEFENMELDDTDMDMTASSQLPVQVPAA
ncbi:hypothetical protein NEUTE1DRAFT_110529 [Neurospora tetrasperma FGSC 2508]|uniref:DNA-directed RNA polymerase II subunit RPB9-like zinc ribbon domain-containing protein n=1 Tax=Neurospora tetrasperma (strain FGSC 2508 / ATCC MYA-4615 / P0657) TaxID=510951 RepID=F8MLJ9_NEUT8|nr:uncharacterized protein NEUTE1DRAFT_110529 [Neurospora tetrasperma FGSC 2508]EGO58418.1 hypothetical protein NEUTE1DRAFT_110529 [Neurospora tetrasperma FGSC 2508]EGZ71250.1 hypothetical protein NEUTE2DRAFT_109691 [Neurospora tetrasperma FGSC 2509]